MRKGRPAGSSFLSSNGGLVGFFHTILLSIVLIVSVAGCGTHPPSPAVERTRRPAVIVKNLGPDKLNIERSAVVPEKGPMWDFIFALKGELKERAWGFLLSAWVSEDGGPWRWHPNRYQQPEPERWCWRGPEPEWWNKPVSRIEMNHRLALGRKYDFEVRVRPGDGEERPAEREGSPLVYKVHIDLSGTIE